MNIQKMAVLAALTMASSLSSCASTMSTVRTPEQECNGDPQCYQRVQNEEKRRQEAAQEGQSDNREKRLEQWRQE